MKIQEFVSGAFYINLEHRKDKNEFMIEQFKRLGLDAFVERFPAISAFDTIDYRVDDNHKMFLLGQACSLSHKNIIQIAKDRGYKNVLIFEDDALFYENETYTALQIIEEALNELTKINNWDIFYFGANLHDKELKLYSDHIIKCDCCTSTQAYILNSTSFDKVLENKFDKPFDVIDIYLNNTFKNKYLVYPAAVIQKGGGVSDIGGHVCFNEEFWLSHYNKPIIKCF